LGATPREDVNNGNATWDRGQRVGNKSLKKKGKGRKRGEEGQIRGLVIA